MALGQWRTARVRTGHVQRVGVTVHHPTQVVHECVILPLMSAAQIILPVRVSP